MFEVDIKIDPVIAKAATMFPQPFNWAVKEAAMMTGGHVRKQVREFIEGGGAGWAPLSPVTKRMKGGRSTPLYNLGKLVRFRVGRSRGRHRLTIGFFPTKLRRKASRARTGQKYRLAGRGIAAERKRFRESFGMTHEALARKHEMGERTAVTNAMRRHLAGMGVPLKRGTRYLKVPSRPMIGAVMLTEGNRIPGYFTDKLASKFKERMTWSILRKGASVTLVETGVS